MPRSAQDIINQAEGLAAYFKDGFQSDTPTEIATLRAAAHRKAVAEGDVARAVVDAVRAGRPWKEIGAAVGTSGEAARQRYGKLAGQPPENVTGALVTAVEDAAKLAVDATKAIATAAATAAKNRAASRGSSRSAATGRYVSKTNGTTETVKAHQARGSKSSGDTGLREKPTRKSSEPAAAQLKSPKSTGK
jgi:hypothetical protein